MRYLFPLSPYNQQRQYEKPVWVYPAHLAMYATYLKNQGHEVIWDSNDDDEVDAVFHDQVERIRVKDDFQIDVPFEQLPIPDRIFTDAKHRRWQSYGNYKFHPATHMMVSNLCWYGKCTFCIDTEKLQTEPRGVRPVAHAMEEIDDLIRQGYKEVFDDSGTFPVGQWFDQFCEGMRSRRGKIVLGCNLKPLRMDYRRFAEAGFRFILVGLESANQETLDRIQKGQKARDFVPVLKEMTDAGLEPHITVMSSYPWETEQDEQRTIDLFHYLLRKGYARTGQVSIYSPPRTAPDPHSIGHQRVPKYFDVYKYPEFWYQQLRKLRRWEDVTYLVRGGRLVFEEHWRKLWHVLRLQFK